MIGRIFLSASVPRPDSGNFQESANPFLIQFAVRELLTVCLGRRQIVWGGHPAITPMVWAVCEDLGVDYSKYVALYQSRLFEDVFPEENRRFANVVHVEPIGQDPSASLEAMRTQMLSGSFDAAVFIGGMQGVLDEHSMFSRLHPHATVVAVCSPGGAAKQLADQLGQTDDRIDFARMFTQKLGIAITEPRDRKA